MTTRDVDFALAPFDDRVVVKSREAAKTDASGLVIHDIVKDGSREGVVEAVVFGRDSA